MLRISRLSDGEPRYSDLVIARQEGNEEVIGVTGNHRFWINGEGWVEAAELRIGDELITMDGERARVVEVRERNAAATTYNLEVDDFDTYFVGQTGVWVHNGGPAMCPATSTKALNLKEASQLLGRTVTGWDQVTVGELRNLVGTGPGTITRTNLTRTLRGKSTQAKREVIRLVKDVLAQTGVKDGVIARVNDKIVVIPRSAAQDGRSWHLGHFGEPFTDLVDRVDGSISVTEFRNWHWNLGFMEAAGPNMSKGAATTQMDWPH